jgi:GNAT superfamily N-acetyltransferase
MTMDFRIRATRRGDEATLFALILELARFEKLEHVVTGDAGALAEHLFGERPVAEALVAEDSSGGALGFALFFSSYSTFLTRPGLYLEDLFVVPAARRHGIGTALLREVGRLARERGAGRLEWAVLDWNESAIKFYERLGATVLPDWRICRVTGAALDAFSR